MNKACSFCTVRFSVSAFVCLANLPALVHQVFACVAFLICFLEFVLYPRIWNKKLFQKLAHYQNKYCILFFQFDDTLYKLCTRSVDNYNKAHNRFVGMCSRELFQFADMYNKEFSLYLCMYNTGDH